MAAAASFAPPPAPTAAPMWRGAESVIAVPARSEVPEAAGGVSTGAASSSLEAAAEAAIPAELKEYPHWLVWRREMRAGRETKVPYNARTGRPASVTDPRSWTTFERARAASPSWDGIGFVLTAQDPYCGLDLDDCRDPTTGAIAPWARQIIEEVKSYTEISPSGRGVRVFVRATVPPGWRKRGLIEVYDRNRYLTVTGNHLTGTPERIEDRTEAIAALHARYGTNLGGGPDSQPLPAGPASVPERWARLVEKNPRVRAAWEGRTATPEGSASAKDMLLAHEIRRCGFGPEEARQILAAAPYPVGGGRPEAYLDRTVARAFEKGRQRKVRPYGAIPVAPVEAGVIARLPRAPLALYVVLCRHRMRESNTVLKNAIELAREAGIHPKTLGGAAARLVKEGLIERPKRVAGGRLLYRLLYFSPPTEMGVRKATGQQEEETRVPQPFAEPSVPPVPEGGEKVGVSPIRDGGEELPCHGACLPSVSASLPAPPVPSPLPSEGHQVRESEVQKSAPTRCRACGGETYWRSPAGVWACDACHPPADLALVVERRPPPPQEAPDGRAERPGGRGQEAPRPSWLRDLLPSSIRIVGDGS